MLCSRRIPSAGLPVHLESHLRRMHVTETGFVIVSFVPRRSAGEAIVAVADTKTGPVLWNRLDEQASYPDLCA